MKYIDPSIYDKNYYLSQCLGSDEFKSSNGKSLHPRVKKLLKMIPVNKNSVVLDVGCGRGDLALNLSRNVRRAYGIDYSKDAIKIANAALKDSNKTIRDKVSFKQMNAKKLDFPDNYFDVVISIDVFEHLYKNELEVVMKEIKRILKKDGILFVDTNTNKWLYDFTYKYYIRPMNALITKIDMTLKRTLYTSMPKDPRISAEKIQHINEPTYFYLKNLFKRHNFSGKILTEAGYLKTNKNLRSYVYNFATTLHPVSEIFPINLFFGWSFICIMRNKND